jgi:SIR2-like protein
MVTQVPQTSDEGSSLSPPNELVDALREGRAAVFVGAGASMAAGLPSWDELVSVLARNLGINAPSLPYSADFLLKVPQYYVNQSDSRRDLMRILERLIEDGKTKFRKTKPKLHRPIHHYLAQLPVKMFYTTNFDKFLEEELHQQGIEHVVIDSEKMARQFTDRRRCQVRKIHGSIPGDWDDLVLTRSDFSNLPSTRPILYQALGDDLISHAFIFVGYSLRDPDFSSVYNSYFATMKGKHQVHFLTLRQLCT